GGGDGRDAGGERQRGDREFVFVAGGAGLGGFHGDRTDQRQRTDIRTWCRADELRQYEHALIRGLGLQQGRSGLLLRRLRQRDRRQPRAVRPRLVERPEHLLLHVDLHVPDGGPDLSSDGWYLRPGRDLYGVERRVSRRHLPWHDDDLSCGRRGVRRRR